MWDVSDKGENNNESDQVDIKQNNEPQYAYNTICVWENSHLEEDVDVWLVGVCYRIVHA